jgi:phosphopantetheine adenylyltransferase
MSPRGETNNDRYNLESVTSLTNQTMEHSVTTIYILPTDQVSYLTKRVAWPTGQDTLLVVGYLLAGK